MIKQVMIFAAGVTVGSLATWKLIDHKYKTKYEQLVKEDTESIKETFYQRLQEEVDKYGKDIKVVPDPEKLSAINKNKPDIKTYEKIVEKTNYAAISNPQIDKSETLAPVENPMSDKPYIITPDQFDYEDDYEKITLTYYENGVLTDDYDEPIIDATDIVGVDSLNTFGQHEVDTVYVRNDKLRTDYAIERVNGEYNLEEDY